jgi:hypothetical protein
MSGIWAMRYAVAIQTLDRLEGNGITLVMVEAENRSAAEVVAERIAEARFGCVVVAEHALPWPS